MPHELHATDIDLYREIYITPYIKRCTQVYLSQFCVENRSNVHAAGVRAHHVVRQEHKIGSELKTTRL